MGGVSGDVGCDRGDVLERDVCNVQPCPMWSAWAEWGLCSKSCDGGVRTRLRECYQGNELSDACPGRAEETELCNLDVSSAARQSWIKLPRV